MWMDRTNHQQWMDSYMSTVYVCMSCSASGLRRVPQALTEHTTESVGIHCPSSLLLREDEASEAALKPSDKGALILKCLGKLACSVHERLPGGTDTIVSVKLASEHTIRQRRRYETVHVRVSPHSERKFLPFVEHFHLKCSIGTVSNPHSQELDLRNAHGCVIELKRTRIQAPFFCRSANSTNHARIINRQNVINKAEGHVECTSLMWIDPRKPINVCRLIGVQIRVGDCRSIVCSHRNPKLLMAHHTTIHKKSVIN